MKSAIFDPYLDSLGGGERYIGAFAQTLLKLGWQVDLLWHDKAIVDKLTSHFGLNLTNIKVVPNFFSEPFINKLLKTKNYDLIFYLSDGSIPTIFSGKSWLHLQVPFQDVQGESAKNKLKLKLISRVIVNSSFTKKVIDREFGVSSQVIYPPVDTDRFIPGKKERTILYVGRFSHLLQGKRQQLLIETFNKLPQKDIRGWRLILAGGTTVGFSNEDKLNLQKSIKGKSVELVFDPDLAKLTSLYSHASIFWAAGGYGFDPNKTPEKMEHFGISLVEAMSAGCLPLAVNLGGYPEILTGSSLSKYLWETPQELTIKTLDLIRNSKLTGHQQEIRDRALAFSQEKFTIAISEALKNDFS